MKLSAAAYLQRFNTCVKDVDETYVAFASRLSGLLTYFLEQSCDDDDDNSDREHEPEICTLSVDADTESELEAINEDDLNPVEYPDVSGHIHVFTGNDDSDSDASFYRTQGLPQVVTVQMKLV